MGPHPSVGRVKNLMGLDKYGLIVGLPYVPIWPGQSRVLDLVPPG